MDKFFNWIKEHKVKTIFIVVGIIAVIVFVFPIAINFLFLDNGGIPVKWEARDYLIFYGSFLAFIGTTALGGVTIWQNDKLNKLNEDQKRPVVQLSDWKYQYDCKIHTIKSFIRIDFANSDQLKLHDISEIKLYIKNTSSQYAQVRFGEMCIREQANEAPIKSITGICGKYYPFSLKPFDTGMLSIVINNEEEKQLSGKFITIEFYVLNSFGDIYKELIEFVMVSLDGKKQSIIIHNNGVKSIKKLKSLDYKDLDKDK